MSSALIIKFFGEKSEKFESWEKLENKMKCFFSRKKRFHLLIGLLCENGKAQNMPVVAGCLDF